MTSTCACQALDALAVNIRAPNLRYDNEQDVVDRQDRLWRLMNKTIDRSPSA